MKAYDATYQVGGKTLVGYLADGSGGTGAPGILVCHQGGGLTDHTRERARMLAELGYIAFALDMYGEVATSRDHAMRLMASMEDVSVLRGRANAGMEYLRARPNVDTNRLAAIGYCFGGGLVLELARLRTELACVVAFHPGLTGLPEKDERKIACKVMVCAGAHDPLIPAEARDKFIALMSACGADWQLLVYGNAGHSFTDRSVDALGMKGFSYHERTDTRSWAAMRELFDETLGPVGRPL
jgi:dienelactone hydrolase